VKRELDHFSPEVAPPAFQTIRESFTSLFGLFWIDTLDRAVFPSRGHFLFIKSEAGYKKIGGDISFLQHFVDWRGFFPVHRIEAAGINRKELAGFAAWLAI